MTTPAKYDAYVALLAAPDLPCLPARTRHYVCAGDPHRRETLKTYFERAYLRHRKADYGTEAAEIISVRRSPLHLVGRKRSA